MDSDENSFLSPRTKFNIIDKAVKLVPFLKYGVGILGVVVIISFLNGYSKNIGLLFWSIFAFIILMAVLFLFSKFNNFKDTFYKKQVGVLSWSIVLLIVLTLLFFLTSMFFNYPLKLCKWIDPNCISKQNPDRIKDTTTTKPNSNHTNNLPPKKQSLNPIPNSPKKYITISLQLSHESGGFKFIYINNAKTAVLPESTPFNPRIEIIKNNTPVEIKIITNNGDTCFSSITPNDESFHDRIIPNCK